MLACVVQIDGFDPVAGVAVTLRAASLDEVGVCHLDGQTWWPAIAKLPTLRYDLFDGAFGGQITAPAAAITVAVEQWPDFGRYALADARFRLWTGVAGEPWSSYTLRFDGRITEQPALKDGRADIAFAVDDRWLDTALLPTYAGTTGAEGPAELKGQVKPLSIGAPRYVGGTLVDSVNSVFQVSFGPIRAIEAALERLARFGPPAADYPTYAALVAATIVRGAWATCLARGLVRFGAPPVGPVTFLVQGDVAGPDGSARLPGHVIRRLALLSGGAGRIAEASLVALNAARPYPVAVYLEQQTTARQLIQDLAASVNAVAGVSWTGQLFVVPVGLSTPTITLAADGSSLPPVAAVAQVGIAAPWAKLAIGAARAWTVHALADIAFAAPLIDRGRYDPAETYREGNIVDLADGSRWLYEAGPPITTSPPAAPWTSLVPPTRAADIKYGDGNTLEYLKPAQPGADVTGDHTSKDTAAVGGRPAIELLPVIDRIPAIGRAQELLDGAVIALDRFTRQIDRQRGTIEAALMRAVVEAGYSREVMRGAGIVVDPASGEVRIYAIDRLAERQLSAEILLDATKALVSTKVDAVFVNQQIAAAQLNPADLAALTGLITRVTSAEQRLDGLAARIDTKAEAVIVTGLVATVATTAQTLDALAGQVTLKADKLLVEQFGIRLGSVEQTITALGDVSSYVVEVRSARYGVRRAETGNLAGVLAGFEASQRQLIAAAAAREELIVRMDEADAVLAGRIVTLTAKFGDVDARLVVEQQVRASQVSALAEQTTALGSALGGLSASVAQQFRTLTDAQGAQALAQQQLRAEYQQGIAAEAGRADGKIAAVDADSRGRDSVLGGRADAADADRQRIDTALLAQVSRLDTAVADESGARARAVQQVMAKLGNLGTATVQDLIEALVDTTGKILATRTTLIDINGNLVGTQLVGSPDGRGALNLIDADLKMGTGRVIFDTGSVMMVMGLGFGANRDLVFWFGPSIPIAQCTRANGTIWFGTDNKAYFGGGLSAGVLQNARQSTDLAADASVLVGPFGTKGGRKTVVATYGYYLERASTSSGGGISGQPAAALAVDRHVGSGGWEEISRFQAAGTAEYQPAFNAEEPGYGRQSMSGSVTITDTTAGTNDFSYRLRLVSRTLAAFNFTSPGRGTETQTLSIQSIEE